MVIVIVVRVVISWLDFAKKPIVCNPIMLVGIATGFLLSIIGLARVFFIKASFEEALVVRVGGKSEGEIIFERAISDPFLIIGVVGIIAGIILAFVLPTQQQDKSHDVPQEPQV
jgi:hypothetical protein